MSRGSESTSSNSEQKDTDSPPLSLPSPLESSHKLLNVDSSQMTQGECVVSSSIDGKARRSKSFLFICTPTSGDNQPLNPNDFETINDNSYDVYHGSVDKLAVEGLTKSQEGSENVVAVNTDEHSTDEALNEKAKQVKQRNHVSKSIYQNQSSNSFTQSTLSKLNESEFVSLYPKMSICELEIDTRASNILNQYIPSKGFGSDLWEEEKTRRKVNDLPPIKLQQAPFSDINPRALSLNEIDFHSRIKKLFVKGEALNQSKQDHLNNLEKESDMFSGQSQKLVNEVCANSQNSSETIILSDNSLLTAKSSQRIIDPVLEASCTASSHTVSYSLSPASISSMQTGLETNIDKDALIQSPEQTQSSTVKQYFTQLYDGTSVDVTSDVRLWLTQQQLPSSNIQISSIINDNSNKTHDSSSNISIKSLESTIFDKLTSNGENGRDLIEQDILSNIDTSSNDDSESDSVEINESDVGYNSSQNNSYLNKFPSDEAVDICLSQDFRKYEVKQRKREMKIENEMKSILSCSQILEETDKHAKHVRFQENISDIDKTTTRINRHDHNNDSISNSSNNMVCDTFDGVIVQKTKIDFKMDIIDPELPTKSNHLKESNIDYNKSSRNNNSYRSRIDITSSQSNVPPMHTNNPTEFNTSNSIHLKEKKSKGSIKNAFKRKSNMSSSRKDKDLSDNINNGTAPAKKKIKHIDENNSDTVNAGELKKHQFDKLSNESKLNVIKNSSSRTEDLTDTISSNNRKLYGEDVCVSPGSPLVYIDEHGTSKYVSMYDLQLMNADDKSKQFLMKTASEIIAKKQDNYCSVDMLANDTVQSFSIVPISEDINCETSFDQGIGLLSHPLSSSMKAKLNSKYSYYSLTAKPPCPRSLRPLSYFNEYNYMTKHLHVTNKFDDPNISNSASNEKSISDTDASSKCIDNSRRYKNRHKSLVKYTKDVEEFDGGQLGLDKSALNLHQTDNNNSNTEVTELCTDMHVENALQLDKCADEDSKKISSINFSSQLSSSDDEFEYLERHHFINKDIDETNCQPKNVIHSSEYFDTCQSLVDKYDAKELTSKLALLSDDDICYLTKRFHGALKFFRHILHEHGNPATTLSMSSNKSRFKRWLYPTYSPPTSNVIKSYVHSILVSKYKSLNKQIDSKGYNLCQSMILTIILAYWYLL